MLGGELHYQAVVYHCLRVAGVSRTQLGMNVKQWIETPVTGLFQSRDLRKHLDFRGGFEPIPDIVMFTPEIGGDWRRRNRSATLRQMLVAIEIKASERAGARLRVSEIISDIRKLAAHRDEVRHIGADMAPIMMVIDTAPLETERMISSAVEACADEATAGDVGFFYVSPSTATVAHPTSAHIPMSEASRAAGPEAEPHLSTSAESPGSTQHNAVETVSEAQTC